MKVLFGTETEYCGMSDTLGMRAETARLFDYVLVPHTHTHMRGFVIDDTQDVKDCRAELAASLARAYPALSEAAVRKMAGALKMEELLPLMSQPQVDYERYIIPSSAAWRPRCQPSSPIRLLRQRAESAISALSGIWTGSCCGSAAARRPIWGWRLM